MGTAKCPAKGKPTISKWTRFSWEATPRVRIAEAEEVHADRCVGIGARLDILRACSGRGGEKQCDQSKRPKLLTAMHSDGCGSLGRLLAALENHANTEAALPARSLLL